MSDLPYKYEFEGTRIQLSTPEIGLWRVFGPTADIPFLSFSEALVVCGRLNVLKPLVESNSGPSPIYKEEVEK